MIKLSQQSCSFCTLCLYNFRECIEDVYFLEYPIQFFLVKLGNLLKHQFFRIGFAKLLHGSVKS